MVRPALALLRWRIQVDSFLSRFLVWVAIALWPVAYFVPLHLIKIGHHIPVGTYIAVMGRIGGRCVTKKRSICLGKVCVDRLDHVGDDG